MTAATGVPPEVAAYLGAVREQLRDLPEGERDDLLEEVEASLVEAAGEEGALSARLGPPEAFAAELKSAAGFQGPTTPSPARPRLQGLVDVATRVAADPRARSVATLARELAPIWWLVRAYVAVGLVALATDASWTIGAPSVPRLGDSASAGVTVLFLAVLVSIAVGLGGRRDRRLGRVAALANVVLLAALVPVTMRTADSSSRDALVVAASSPAPVSPPPPRGLVYDGVAVENVYPFSRNGRLLHDVLLFDGFGRPLAVRGPLDPNRRYVETAGGRQLFNAFPIRYYERGTRRVAKPDAAPRVEIPKIATPPLRKP